MTEVQVNVDWQLGKDEDDIAKALVSQINDQGGQVTIKPPKDHAIVFLPFIAGALGVVALAHAVADYFDRGDTAKEELDARRRGGVVIDTRPDPIKITPDPGIPFGTVVVIGKDGETSTVDTTIATKDKKDEIAALLTAAATAAGN